MQENQPTIKPPKDKLLAELILKHKELIWKIHDHDSLLENQVDEHLTEEERKAAWKEYEDEKKGIINMTSNVNFQLYYLTASCLLGSIFITKNKHENY